MVQVGQYALARFISLVIMLGLFEIVPMLLCEFILGNNGGDNMIAYVSGGSTLGAK